MSTGFYVPNKIANSYVENKRNRTGEFVYESDLQDIGVETQAAIQSLNKSYSSVINDAYTNYLNSKQNIMNSNLGQGYKEAYIQQQEQALQHDMEQATLSAAETKQALLKQQYEQNLGVKQAFETDVNYTDRVDVELGKYLEYLKTVNSNGQSYYDAMVSGHGLKDIDAAVGIKAQDVYDALYNAAPKDYYNEKGEAAMNWQDWLKTQIKTSSDQTWYDWYIDQGGYEQFQDAYQKGMVGTVADRLAKQAEEARQKQLYNTAKAKYDKTRLDINAEIDNIALPNLDSIIKGHDYGMIDAGKTAEEKISLNAAGPTKDAVANMGITPEELQQLTGYTDAAEMVKDIGKVVQDINNGRSYSEAISRNNAKFKPEFIAKYFDEPTQVKFGRGKWKTDSAKNMKSISVNAYNALMNTIKQYAKEKKYKEQNVYDAFDVVYTQSK